MMNKMRKMKNKKGFTLMEMLIVVAIIAILIAIAIPTFASSLNKARIATDEANIRSVMLPLWFVYLILIMLLPLQTQRLLTRLTRMVLCPQRVKKRIITPARAIKLRQVLLSAVLL